MPKRLFNRSFLFGVASGVVGYILYKQYKDSFKPLAVKTCEKVLELGQHVAEFAESVKCEVEETRKQKRIYNNIDTDTAYNQCAATNEQSIS